jgi:hypothetical protein
MNINNDREVEVKFESGHVRIVRKLRNGDDVKKRYFIFGMN